MAMVKVLARALRRVVIAVRVTTQLGTCIIGRKVMVSGIADTVRSNIPTECGSWVAAITLVFTSPMSSDRRYKHLKILSTPRAHHKTPWTEHVYSWRTTGTL